MKVFGIDVSKWQGNFDFEKAKSEGVKFAILRGAYTSPSIRLNGGKDLKFDEYYQNAKEQGLNVGVYQYSMAQTVAQAKKEAEFLYEHVLKGKQFELPIYIDVEDAVQMNLGKRNLTNIIKAWCEYLESKNYFVGVYSTKFWFKNYMYDNELLRYTHWIAQWTSACTYEHTNVLGMWQFGGETNLIRSNKIAGVVCDQDYMFQDFPTMIKTRKLNGFDKTIATEIKPKIKVGDLVNISKDAVYYNGKAIPSWVKSKKWYVKSILGKRAVIDKDENKSYSIFINI